MSKPKKSGRPIPPMRADVLTGRKLPFHSLWESLVRSRLVLDFCPAFFNNEMSYQQAEEWLLRHGLKFSQSALQCFYNSLDMRLRYAAVAAAQSADTAKAELPADIEQATRDRIAQHKFELAFMNLSEAHRLELIHIQQNEEGMRGNFALKRERLKLDREKFELLTAEKLLDKALRQKADEINASSLSQADKIAAMRKAAFKDVESLEQSGKLKLPK